jgi:hypothetical protein
LLSLCSAHRNHKDLKRPATSRIVSAQHTTVKWLGCVPVLSLWAQSPLTSTTELFRRSPCWGWCVTCWAPILTCRCPNRVCPVARPSGSQLECS